MTRLRDIGELEAIRRIVRRLPSRADIAVGAGDDCAVVRPCAQSREDWVLTSDPVVEGIHFTPGTPAAAVGHKAVGRVLSDIGAMGAEPRWCLLDLVAPASTPARAVDAIYDGALKLANRLGLAIVGGDLAQGPALEIHAFGVGAVPRGMAILRSGARPGDAICVTGTLGGSIRGKHLRFEPRVREGQWLRGWATSMIDLSDGLASDLPHILEMSGAGARLDAGTIPISPAARTSGDDTPPLQHALHDGEDFELLFTVAPARLQPFLRAWGKAFSLRCTVIGHITESPGSVELEARDGSLHPLAGIGYEHFGRPRKAAARAGGRTRTGAHPLPRSRT